MERSEVVVPKKVVSRPDGHRCLPVEQLLKLFDQIGSQPGISLAEFFGRERLEEIGGCFRCSFFADAIYHDLVFRCLKREDCRARLAELIPEGSPLTRMTQVQRFRYLVSA